MKVLVTGVGGQLGYDVMNELVKRKHEAVGSDIIDTTNIDEEVKYIKLDITNKNAVEQVMTSEKPDAVIHCAAWTAVDLAEDDIDICYLVNAVATENIAKICKAIDAKMVYISTDYVFDGTKDGYYEVDDLPNPINVYGKSKLAGEESVKKSLERYFIVRISWAFGVNGNNFVKTMLKLGRECSEINVVSDQVGSPTYTSDLSRLLVDMIESEKYGIYHATNEGECSRVEFAEEIFKVVGYSVKINCITSEQYQTRAGRPMNSKLSKKKLEKMGFRKLCSWKKAVKEYLNEIGSENVKI